MARCAKSLFVVTDRISAFDVILADPIPHKGAVLNQISAFWFKRFGDVPNHLITANFEEFLDDLQEFREQLVGRSMIVKKTKPLPVECVVRGYLAGSGWKEYQQSQSVCGIKLPAGLKLSSQLPEPIFTPATKAEEGHDENIDMKRCAQILGEEVADRVKTLSLEIYLRGRDYADQQGIILTNASRRTLLASGQRINTLSDRAHPVSTNNSCAIIWRPSTGTRLRRPRACRRMLLKKPPRNIWKHFAD